MQIDYGIAAPPPRHVIVHFHMFKNGGTTIESILGREFGGRFATVHGSHASSSLDQSDVAEFVNGHPNVFAFSSHHLRYPLPSIRRTVLFDWFFLRHPLDRLHSVYTYLRDEPTELGQEDPILVLAQTAGPREFMSTMIDESPHFVSNAQTLLLGAGGEFTRPLDDCDLLRAKDTLRTMAVPGTTKLFDESLVAAEHFLGPVFPGIRLHYVPQNVSRGSARQDLRAVWGMDVYEELVRLNRLDIELCEFAEHEVRRRLALVPKHEARLQEFRARCSGLRLQVAS